MNGEREGVVKYRLDYRQGDLPQGLDMAELEAWRWVLHRLGLVGRDPGRYEGLGFGNLSARLGPPPAAGAAPPFVITGTQTGGLEHLEPRHYVVVRACDPTRNRVSAEGPVRPSSEALTHGTIYAQDPRIRCIMHAHSPAIWSRTAALDLPATAAHVPYGTPAMAAEVGRLFRSGALRGRRVVSMLGHEDGVVSWGRSAAEAGSVMVRTLARALA